MSEYTVIPLPGRGTGRLTRVGDAVLFTADASPGASTLVSWLRSTADDPGSVAEGIARVVGENDALPPFVLVVVDGAGATVVTRGGLPLVARSTTGPVDVPTDGTVEGLVHLALAVSGESADPMLEIGSGTVAADGFELRNATAAAATSSVPDAPVTAPSAGASVIGESIGAAAAAPMAKVRGLSCSRGHFNDPRARFCGVCGITMHQASFILIEDVRPALGVLTFADGSFRTVDRDIVVGTDPTQSADVAAGTIAGAPITDGTGTVSPVHAEIRLVEWDVFVVDHGSATGTFVWGQGQTDWERITEGEPRPVTPGTHLSFGGVTATFQSSQNQR
jgi:hypothetical protein